MRVVTAREMYEADRIAAEEIGLSGVTLMENAGHAICRKLEEWIVREERIAILVGAGNNGGDGFVVARILKSRGFKVDVWVAPNRDKIKGDAAEHRDIFLRAGYSPYYYETNEKEFYEHLPAYSVIIDCLLGIGIKGEIRSPYNEIISAVNKCSAKVIAVDLPSGVAADGTVPNGQEPIRANRTITLQYPKTGAFTFPAASYYGTISRVDIGIPPKAFRSDQVRLLWQEEAVKSTLPVRDPSSHKGSHGKGLIIGGSREMTGAPMMTAMAAYRAGAGLITVAVPDVILPVAAASMLEAMYKPMPSDEGSFSGSEMPDLEAYHAVAVGPGMGRGKGSAAIVKRLLEEDIPLLIDADGLFHLSSFLEMLERRNGITILTPHPGEMARLLNCSIGYVQSNRFEVSRDFAVKYGVFLVLKGPFTIVTTPNGEQFVNTTGNASLAKGGSGDVLAGTIFGFMLQDDKTQSAISNAVYVHGGIADNLVATAHSLMDVMATDIINGIPLFLRTFFQEV
ncbi:NAD(P)H-hydrate dehydratase [Pseudalkalibacillus caeni]|uniref:Bifunctional NAD(P)H-hydrate repair enzyme n=1 Tax=Exobacillus caeni TaxID=2574798 RepID=A0A5R9F3A4_9BACL|nr:NAD(P)H-hydrate dehydratase [Pseudalkalibacillus caeni]TLS34904.1 NAD(P)H-hydrate dehydratase [Pseudalkalibacillus caeni]